MKVKAKKLGFYDMKRRYPEMDGNPADIFELESENHFSEKWMEKLDPTYEAKVKSSSKKKEVAEKVESVI